MNNNNNINLMENNSNNSELYKVETVNNNNETSIDLELLREFIGKNYDYFTNSKFNIPIFFFNSFYLIYKRMLIPGTILFTVSSILILNELYFIYIIIDVILAFTFNKIYLKYAKNKVTKIKKENPDKNLDNLKYICREYGNTNKKEFVIASAINIAIALIIMLIIFLINFIPTFINNTFKKEETKNSTTDAFTGINYNENTKINNIFSITPPDIFKNKSTSWEYIYLYEGENNVFNDCQISLGEIENYKSINNMLDTLTKHYENNNITTVESIKVNDITYKYFKYDTSFNTTYLYLTTNKKKIYLLTYKIEKNSNPDCLNYKDEIIKTIFKK